MAEVLCPQCGKPNPGGEERCQFCGSMLKPGNSPISNESQTLRPGDEPIKRDTSEFEKVKSGGESPIHPGEAPTKKDTGELERALPGWLRSLREGKRPKAGETMGEPGLEESQLPEPPSKGETSPPTGQPDWLAGLGEAAASEEEEIPDWLAGLREGTPANPVPSSTEEGEAASETGNEDWLSRLGKEESEPTANQPLEGEALKSEPGADDKIADWLHSLGSPEIGKSESSASLQGGGDLPDWKSGISSAPEDIPVFPENAAEIEPPRSTPAGQEKTNGSPEVSNPQSSGGETGSIPDWIANFGNPAAEGVQAGEEKLPDWLANLEQESGTESGAGAAFENGSPQAPNPHSGTPDWLSRLKGEFGTENGLEQPKDIYPAEPQPLPVSKPVEPIPDWLNAVSPSTPPSEGTPALISEDQEIIPGEPANEPFSMESPGWLAKLKPDQAPEKDGEINPETEEGQNLETAELPSWVQAMRPVEAVVESRTAQLDEHATERSGPLAGLRGVLPAEPGMSILHKPPVYISKVQISEGQQRYASSLEKLIASESVAQKTEKQQKKSSRIWRWAIGILLIMAASLALASRGTVSPTQQSSSDKGAAASIVQSLPANVPVLVAFDYSPALEGELEAVAAPILDQLMAKGTPLALISTSPTGPALAEHFMQTTPLVNVHLYQSDVQYVDLGYLAGGPSGILFFADSMSNAAPLSVDGRPAWTSGPLQGIQKLSDFGAVIVLTDNADIGRNWIEQAGPLLGGKPMIMAISAQAEPMIHPYLDSGQLKGLVSGLLDAKIYEQDYGRPGLAYHYWNSFSVGMLLAELVIIAGVIVNLIAGRHELTINTRGEA